MLPLVPFVVVALVAPLLGAVLIALVFLGILPLPRHRPTVADRDGDGEINIDEFYRIMKKKGNFLEDLSSDDDF